MIRNLNDLKEQLQRDLLAFIGLALNEDTKNQIRDIIEEKFDELQEAEESGDDEIGKDEIAIKWCVDDVLMQAENDDVQVTTSEARKILGKMEKYHDANNGITWDTISIYLQDLKREKSK